MFNISELSENKRYDFHFTVTNSNTSDDEVCQISVPSEFRFMANEEVELITSLLISYFVSTDIFIKAKAEKEIDNLGCIPSELVGETVTLSICSSQNDGFSFDHNVPEAILGSVGEFSIAYSIEKLLIRYENEILAELLH